MFSLSLFDRIVPLEVPVNVSHQSEFTRIPNSANGNCLTECFLDNARLENGGEINNKAVGYTAASVLAFKQDAFLLFLSHVSGYYIYILYVFMIIKFVCFIL